MNPLSPATLPIARLRLIAHAEAPLPLPLYAGPMLCGAFGHALLALLPLPHADQPDAPNPVRAGLKSAPTIHRTHKPTATTSHPKQPRLRVAVAGFEGLDGGLVLQG